MSGSGRSDMQPGHAQHTFATPWENEAPTILMVGTAAPERWRHAE